MLLTNEQLHEIREIIRDHHLAFVASVISPDAVAPEILERLKAKGIVDVKISSIEDAYLYGQVLAALDEAKGMPYGQFKEYLHKKPIPLTEVETRAIDMAQHSAAQYAVGLGNRVELDTGNIIYEADTELRNRMRDEIRDATAENIAKRESVKKLKSNLGWATRDWARDWDRIAVTEKHTAMERGQADHIAKRYGPDALVFKRVEPNACAHCRRLYLGPDGNPRIFKLSTLEANGSNFGKKAADWLPIIGDHPWGQCQLMRKPAGWGFDENGRLSPKGKGGIEYEDESDLAMALSQEDDLQKAFKLQGHTEFQGLPIAIENKPGSVRKWTGPDGKHGETKMKYAYGYVRRTKGADEDEIDVFLGPDPRAENAYIVHQQDNKTGRYDEDKVMLGFSNQQLAEKAYLASYDSPDFMITTSPMSVEHFKRWIKGTNPPELFKKGQPVIPLVIPPELLEKAGGPFIGPRGGKWADVKHTIPWKKKKDPRKAKLLRDGYVGVVKPDSSIAETEKAIQKQPVEHFIAFDADEKILVRLKGDKHSCKIPPAYRAMLKDSIFTHNHPGSGCLSLEDINLGVMSNVKEIRAVTANGSGVYSLKRPGDSWFNLSTTGKDEEDELYGDPCPFQRTIGMAYSVGLQRARYRMDNHIIAAGGVAGDISHESFSQEIFDGFVSEETFKSYNEYLGAQYRWELKKEPFGASSEQKGTGPKRDNPGRKSDSGVPGEQLKLFKGRPLTIHINGEPLEKSGPYIGPRGGKWQDPQHKIPWKQKKAQKPVSSHFEVKIHPRISGRDDTKETFRIVGEKDGNISISRHEDSDYGPTMPKESLKHFINDLSGKVDLQPSGNKDIDAVTSGKAEFLGKGDDGMAFKVGDKVVKVSTTVPYQPENPGHRTPDQAAKMLENQVKVGNKLADMGIQGIQRSEFIRHGDKGFQIKQWVRIPEKFTRDQLDKIQDIVIAVHKVGYAIRDEIQAGLDENGDPIMFDVGKAAPQANPEDTEGIYSDATADRDSLSFLYSKNGEEFIRRDVSEGQRDWDRVMNRIEKWKDNGKFKFARHNLSRAAEKLRKEARITKTGEDLNDELSSIDSVEDLHMTAIDIFEKRAEAKMSKSRVASIVGAAISPAVDRAPGQSSAANYAFHVPTRERVKPILPDDLMGIRELDRETKIKMDKEDFEVRGSFHKDPQTMTVPMSEPLDPEEIERNRKRLDELYLGNIGKKNQVPVEGE